MRRAFQPLDLWRHVPIWRGSPGLLVTPARDPASRSACRTQPRSVSPVQPIFPAIEAIAAHCEAGPLCSSTIRTARSRTSGENLFEVFFSLPEAHSLKTWGLRQTRGGSPDGYCVGAP